MKKTLVILLALVLAASCVGVLFAAADEELPEGAQHVNHYSWGCYCEMIIYGEGKNCVNHETVSQACKDWIALKVENVSGTYTVTQIEGNGDEKVMTAPADGFIVYCYSSNSNDPDSFAAAGNVSVGDVLYSYDFDWKTNVASETAVGQLVFVPAASVPAESSDETSSEAESSVEAASSEEAVSSEAAASSEPVQAGDAGIIVFAVLGIAAIAGVAVAVKVRR